MAFTADHNAARHFARLMAYDKSESKSVVNLARAYLELHMKLNKDEANANCAACKGDPYECAAIPSRHCEAK
jgi:hypothetical protein